MASSVDAFVEVVAESSGIRGDVSAPDEAREGDEGGGACPIGEDDETGGWFPPAPLVDETESRFGSGSVVPGEP